jgi:AcrR family transcriptional regulator
MQIFLKEGFEATSYEKIAKEMGLSKPSLYNSFGDKPSLFQHVLEGYAITARSHIVESFSNRKTLDEAVKNLLRSAARFYSSHNGPSLGCLLVGTALPASTRYDGIRETLSNFTDSLDRLLEETVSQQYAQEAQKRGQSPRSLALQISSLVFTLAVRARTGLSQRQLISLADELAEVVAARA